MRDQYLSLALSLFLFLSVSQSLSPFLLLESHCTAVISMANVGNPPYTAHTHTHTRLSGTVKVSRLSGTVKVIGSISMWLFVGGDKDIQGVCARACASMVLVLSSAMLKGDPSKPGKPEAHVRTFV